MGDEEIIHGTGDKSQQFHKSNALSYKNFAAILLVLIQQDSIRLNSLKILFFKNCTVIALLGFSQWSMV